MKEVTDLETGKKAGAGEEAARDETVAKQIDLRTADTVSSTQGK